MSEWNDARGVFAKDIPTKIVREQCVSEILYEKNQGKRQIRAEEDHNRR
jgi:hypothetical protein